MRQQYLKDVASLALDEETCVGCGRCAEVCPHGVFAIEGGKARLLQKDRCMECGACAQNCPVGALCVTPGVGCAYAIIMGWLTGSEPSCDCSSGDSCC